MNNVIPFPDSDQKLTAEQVAMRENVIRADHVRQLRIALTERPMMRPADQERVAQALHGLLQRVEQRHGVRKAKVLRQAGIGTNGDSTKHLSQYAIPSDLSRDEILRRSKRLRKKTAPYLAIAKAAAKLAALDEDDVLLEVFGQADFGARAGGTREPAPEFEELASRLRYIAEGIARKYDLTAYFHEVERAGVAPSPTGECYERERESGPLALEEIEIRFQTAAEPYRWPIEFNQPSWEAEIEALPAYPSLVLGAWEIGSPFAVSVTAEMTAADGSACQVSGTVQGHYTAELRLCIAPIGKEREATPAVQVRLSPTLSPLHPVAPAGRHERTLEQHGERALTDADPIIIFPEQGWCPLKTGQSKVVGRVAATNETIVCEICVERDAIPDPFRGYFSDIDSLISDHSFSSPSVRFLPITGVVCQDWFGFPHGENKYHTSERWLDERALGPALSESFTMFGYNYYFHKYPRDTLADELDVRLCNSSHGLDLLLEAQAKRLRELFEEERSSVLEYRDAEWARVQERWKAGPTAAEE
jgi:hypothetical protein